MTGLPRSALLRADADNDVAHRKDIGRCDCRRPVVADHSEIAIGVGTHAAT
ncbi:hypothetical protein LQL77_30595 [Rhodococcus cerastii]|nr:hypothetical protein [Rhodococcus cerastii]